MAVVLCEVLCFIVHKYGKCPDQLVKTVLHDFYTDEDICQAKKLLHSELAKLNVDGVPDRLVTRKGDNKSKLDIDDMYMMISKADELKLLSKLPKFVAGDLNKLPWCKPEDIDICILARKVASLEDMLKKQSHTVTSLIDSLSKLDLNTMMKQCQAVDALVETVKNIELHATTSAEQLKTFDCVAESLTKIESRISDAVVTVRDEPSNTDNQQMHVTVGESAKINDNSADHVWADVVAMHPSVADDDYTVVQHKKSSKATNNIRICGTKKSASEVTAVPRRLTAFVGRLHKDTTAESLTKYLTDAGLNDIRCRLIIPKNGRQFATTAFFVSCPVMCKSLFYDENVWPEGCELRDWYVKKSSQN